MMHELTWLLGVFCIAGGLAGCQQSTRVFGSLAQNQVSVIDYASNRRGAYVIAKNGDDQSPVLIVTEPAPDTALAYRAILQASVKGIENLDASARADLSQQVIDLAKRSQTLQIQREALYRLNVLLVNGSIGQDQAAILYLQVLKTIQVIALTELANSNLPDKTKIQMINQAAKHLFNDVTRGSWTDPDPAPAPEQQEQQQEQESLR